MPSRMIRSFQGLILLALSIFFAAKAANGQLTWYINARFIPLTIFGILFLAVLAQTVFTELRRARQREQKDHENENDHEHHDHAPSAGNLWVMLIPLAIGILIPARPLDSAAFSTKGFNTSAPLVNSDASARIFETESEERNILDWLKLFNFEEDVAQFEGQSASVVGFVYFDDTLGTDQFYVSRFVVSCCAADGFAIAMPVQWEEARALEQDSWILVKGSIAITLLEGNRVPLLIADSVQSVPAPEQPYLFP